MITLLRFAAIAGMLQLTAAISSGATDTLTHCATAYCAQLVAKLDHLKRQMPAITQSAEAAARLYVQDDYAIATYGDEGLVSEAGGRAGGLMGMEGPQHVTDPQWKGIVLFFPRADRLTQDLATAAELLKQSKMVVLFGRQPPQPTNTKFSAVIETAPLPDDPVLNIAALWTWTGEFVAACTRLGKLPPIYQSYSVPGSKERAARYRNLKFHAETPRPIAPGKAGTDYLRSLQNSLAVLRARELSNIRRVAARATAAIRGGHTAYVSVTGHAIIHHVPLPGLKSLNDGWTTLRKDAPIEKGDLIFCDGYDRTESFANVMTAAHQAGAELAWSLTDYRKDPRTGRPPGVARDEIFINQRWVLGDAVVTIPGYDIKMLPPSGVLAETILFMIEAELHDAQQPPPPHR